MLKKLKTLGKNISVAEIHMVSKDGMWLLIKDQEFFLPFTEYPWFKKATVSQIFNVKVFHKTHLHWPALDVDLDIETLQFPEKYKLISK
jgi:hypothetical protein